MVELNAVLKKKEEELLGVVLPESGKMQVEDLCAFLNIKTLETIKALVREKKITYHRIGGKWVIDLEDFWKKTEQHE